MYQCQLGKKFIEPLKFLSLQQLIERYEFQHTQLIQFEPPT